MVSSYPTGNARASAATGRAGLSGAFAGGFPGSDYPGQQPNPGRTMPGVGPPRPANDNWPRPANDNVPSRRDASRLQQTRRMMPGAIRKIMGRLNLALDIAQAVETAIAVWPSTALFPRYIPPPNTEITLNCSTNVAIVPYGGVSSACGLKTILKTTWASNVGRYNETALQWTWESFQWHVDGLPQSNFGSGLRAQVYKLVKPAPHPATSAKVIPQPNMVPVPDPLNDPHGSPAVANAPRPWQSSAGPLTAPRLAGERAWETTDRGPLARVQPRPARPKPPNKERKAYAYSPLVGLALNAGTESVDAINAVHDALPEECQASGWGALDKLAALAACWEHLDVEQAIENIVANAVEDAIIGRVSGATSRAGRKGPSVGGVGFGARLGRGTA